MVYFLMMGSNEKQTGANGSHNASMSSNNSTPVFSSKLSFLTKALLIIIFFLLAAIPMKFIFERNTIGQTDSPRSMRATQLDLPTEKQFNQMIANIQSGDPAKNASVITGIAPQMMISTMAEDITELQIEIDAKL